MNKNTFLLLCATFFSVLLFTGCMAGKTGAATPAITAVDLQHKNFMLVEANGYKLENNKPDKTHLEFGEDMHASGGMCNRFMGKADLHDGKLFIKAMAMTRMLCYEQKMNEIEMQFVRMMEKGADVFLDKNQLTLTAGEDTMRFVQADWIR